MRAEFRISNYRCYHSHRPVTIIICDGETAFVGSNNSGKSSILRFFYEFRRLFQVLTQDKTALVNALLGRAQPLALDEYTTHVEHLFNNSNNYDIVINIKSLIDDYIASDDSVSYERSVHVLPKALEITVRRADGAWTVSLIDADDRPLNFQDLRMNNLITQVWNGPDSAPYFIAHFIDALKRLSDSVYVGPFRSALGEAGINKYFDITIGPALIKWWDLMRSGHDPLSDTKITTITDLLGRLFGYKSITIEANDTNTNFHVRLEGKRYLLSQIGSGFSQFLILCANLASRQPKFIIIDEPELHLHPSLQVDFVSTIRTFASNGVIFSTHSIGLARSAADRIYSVRRREGHSEIRIWERTGKLAELAGEMGFSAYQDLGFEKILLVEGPTEVKTVQQILRLLGKDHKIVLIPLGGGSMINGTREAELAEIKRLTDRVYALVDSEKGAGTDPPKGDRQAFKAACDRAEIECHLTERRATENYLTDAAVKKAMTQNVRALGPFDRLDDAPNPKWGKNDNWLIAREMSKEDWLENDIGAFLDSI